MKNFDEARKNLEAVKTRSAWSKGVKIYAGEIIDSLEEDHDADDLCNVNLLNKAMLNGADDWTQYSEGGCSLIFDQQIAERLCNNTELKATDHGMKDPNSRENWIQCQARALYQAAEMVRTAFGF